MEEDDRCVPHLFLYEPLCLQNGFGRYALMADVSHRILRPFLRIPPFIQVVPYRFEFEGVFGVPSAPVQVHKLFAAVKFHAPAVGGQCQCHGQAVFFQPFRVGLHILGVQNGVLGVKVFEIAGVVAHQHAVIRFGRGLGQLVQPDGGGEEQLLLEVALQNRPDRLQKLEIGLAAAGGPVAVKLHLADGNAVVQAHRVKPVCQVVGERTPCLDSLRCDEDHRDDFHLQAVQMFQRFRRKINAAHGGAGVVETSVPVQLYIEKAEIDPPDAVAGQECLFIAVKREKTCFPVIDTVGNVRAPLLLAVPDHPCG